MVVGLTYVSSSFCRFDHTGGGRVLWSCCRLVYYQLLYITGRTLQLQRIHFHCCLSSAEKLHPELHSDAHLDLTEVYVESSGRHFHDGDGCCISYKCGYMLGSAFCAHACFGHLHVLLDHSGSSVVVWNWLLGSEVVCFSDCSDSWVGVCNCW